MRKISLLLLGAFFIPIFGHAQELAVDESKVVRAEVVEVRNERKEMVPGTGVEVVMQDVVAEILEADHKGERVTFTNDFIALEKGERFFLNMTQASDGAVLYSVRDIDRRLAIAAFVALFVAVIVFFGGVQGIRSLLSLVGSFWIIAYVLLPGLLAGHSPVLLSTVVATAILFVAIYVTHGFNRESTAAFVGTIIAIVFTGILASCAIAAMRLSGLESDESVYLNLSTQGALNISGLLLGSIIIGALGVLDDVAITQVSVVRELYHTAPHLEKKEVYAKALRVGKEHVGAVVNTLALAYTGASLPLLLLFSTGTTSIAVALNYEVFATEVARTVVGSIGLIMTVPIVTALAVFMLAPRVLPFSKTEYRQENDVAQL